MIWKVASLDFGFYIQNQKTYQAIQHIATQLMEIPVRRFQVAQIAKMEILWAHTCVFTNIIKLENFIHQICRPYQNA